MPLSNRGRIRPLRVRCSLETLAPFNFSLPPFQERTRVTNKLNCGAGEAAA
jgi:hypothetical protein